MKSAVPSDKDVRVTFVLRGEEAREFRRYANKQKGSLGMVGHKLIIKGMKAEGLLPKWWR